jgi:predicted acylesterase/phospholipase RssA
MMFIIGILDPDDVYTAIIKMLFHSLLSSACIAAMCSALAGPSIPSLMKTSPPVDLILSSGFLAFARQAGVLAAVEDYGLNVDRIVGTSSGSLAGSLFAAGLSATQVADELSRQRPIALLTPSINLHRGAFSLGKLTAHLRELLPKDFTGLQSKLAVGVFEKESGKFKLVEDGDLPAAVAASCAIPFLFQPVLAGSPPMLLADGGAKSEGSYLYMWRRLIYQCILPVDTIF